MFNKDSILYPFLTGGHASIQSPSAKNRLHHSRNHFAISYNVLAFTFCFLALIFCFTSVSAQSFKTHISNSSIGKNQYVQVSYEITDASSVDEFQVPKFKDWTVVSGPMSSTSQSIVNGVSSQSSSYSYFLQPKHTGRLVVEGAMAFVNGKSMNSGPATVEVLNKNVDDQAGGASQSTDPFAGIFSDPFPAPQQQQPQQPEVFRDAIILQPNESAPEKIKKNLFIKVNTSKNTCFEGEPIVATYKLYSRLDLTKLSVSKRPSFSGFSSFDLEQPDQPFTIESVDGRNYKCWVIRKVQLYALQPGQLTLEPAEVDCEVQFARGEMIANGTYDPYSSNSYVRTNYSLRSTPVTVMAEALPAAGKPANFNGAVGSFRIAAAVDDPAPGKDDAVHLGIRISGSGNFSMVHAPAVQWPANLESYDPKEIENLDKTSIPINGDKLFDYTFLTHQPGKLTIPAASFSYFDTESKSYKTISTQPVELQVGAVSKHPQQLVTEQNGSNWPVLFSKIASILMPLLAVGLLIVLVLSFTKRKKKKEDINEKKTNHDAWQKLLQEAEELKKAKENSAYQPVVPATTHEHETYLPAGLTNTEVLNPVVESVARETNTASLIQSQSLVWNDDHNLFYKALKNEMAEALAIKADMPNTSDKNKLLQELRTKGADEEILDQIDALIDECDSALYSPISSSDDRQNMLEEAKFLLGKL